MSTLSTEQVLLLNNLMYMGGMADASDFEGQTVYDMVNSIDTSTLNGNSGLTTDTENKMLIEAIKSDPELCNMKIVATNVDNGPGGGGGKSAIFVNESSKEAVVTFRGTSANEWKDNFQGGYQTDTAQQQNALDWYQQAYEDNNLGDYYVTVTGHSKGGNKAKYITVLDDSVDRCISFDGQGFSDEFMDKYQANIGLNQNKIQNHNTDKDYVNILLNDIGETTYYEGQHYGDGKMLEAHCADTLLKFNEDGTVSMVPGSQYGPLNDMDKFMNGYLRTLDSKEKKEILDLFGDIAQSARNGGLSVDEMKELLLDPKNEGAIASFLAYTIKYAEENPELAANISDVMKELGFGQYVGYVEMVQEILETTFDFGIFGSITMLELLQKIEGVVSGWDWLNDKIVGILMEYTGLSREEAEQLLDIICHSVDNLDEVDVNYDGKDRKIKDTSFGGVGYIKEDTAALLSTAAVFHNSSKTTSSLLGEFESAMSKINFTAPEIAGLQVFIKLAFNRLARAYDSLGTALEKSGTNYDRCEQKVVDNFS